MTPQSAFTVVAPVAAGRADALRLLLDGMNGDKPGVADPANALLQELLVNSCQEEMRALTAVRDSGSQET